MNSKKTKTFEIQLTDLINNSNLPVNILYYIVKNAELQLLSIYDQECLDQIKQEEELAKTVESLDEDGQE